LIATGAGRIVLTARATGAIVFQGNVGSVAITQDFNAPANLLVEPNPTRPSPCRSARPEVAMA
jgi:K+-transporting ATPase c subunit